MTKDADIFADGWQKNWTVNFHERRAVHMPSGLVTSCAAAIRISGTLSRLMLKTGYWQTRRVSGI